jgi:hypothetical protein
VLRAAMRLYEPLGRGGFTLCVMDAYTGARWGELVGQQRHEYDSHQQEITIQQPLKEVGGKVFKGGRRIDLDEDRPAESVGGSSKRPRKAKKGRTKTPAGTRQVQLPPSVAVLYKELLDSHQHSC